MNPPTISYLTDIYFQPHALDVLPEVMSKLGIARPLLVTDRGLVDLGMLSRLPVKPAAVFDAVPSNPTEADVLRGLDTYREYECDGIIALGGGSPIDCAKAIALLVSHLQPLSQYALIHGGATKISATGVPLVAIPTTAGTGSEVGRAALITLNSGSKLALVSRHLIPDAAICDPALTLGLPPALTAATGMDAVCHCVETFCSPNFNPVADAIALDGLVRALAHIKSAVADGSDPTPRGEMMMSALEGGLTFQKGLGLIHSLSHALGGLTQKNLHHGTLNAIFLPHVLRFNMDGCPEKLDRIANLLGIAARQDLPDFFTRLAAELALPARLRDMGVGRGDLEPMPQLAYQDHCTATNPRPATVEDCRTIYEAAY